VGALTRDLREGGEASTALLLYSLLQTPRLKAHDLLGALPEEVRARLLVESWKEAQLAHNGIPIEHIRYAARRIALEVCQEGQVDSRHLLMTCLVGSGLLGGGPELGIPDTDSRLILGRSNTAARALSDAGIDPLAFLNGIRCPAVGIKPARFPSFYLLWPSRDRTRLLRIEEVGEFVCRTSGEGPVYPATLGLLDMSMARTLPSLLQFEALLGDPEAPESEFQRFFEEYPEYLMSDEYIAVRPGILLSGSGDFDLKPDFFLQRRDAPLWDIAELKLPLEKIVQGRPARRGLAAAVRWGMDQLRTYREYFLDTQLAMRFRQRHGLEVYYPRLTLIIGRDRAFGTYLERQRLSPPEVRLLTYDDVLRVAKHRALVLPFVEEAAALK
jgi:hypothetical protein